jgi:hypothetical protein
MYDSPTSPQDMRKIKIILLISSMKKWAKEFILNEEVKPC